MKYFLLSLLLVGMIATNCFSQCNTSNSFAYLNVNNINATIDNAGMLFSTLVNGTAYHGGYEAPKGGGVNSMFTAGLWIGGIDPGKQLHLAASTYRQNGNDYSVGPYNYTGSFNFDTVWAVYKSTIDSFRAGQFSTIPKVIKYWPAQGNPYLQNLPNQSLAPFVDVNSNGVYDPANGDYPDIRGDEATWEIFNDGCTPHNESFNSAPLNIEVQILAYAFNDTGYLSNTAFYRYTITNKASVAYDSTFIGLFADPDIGCYLDDYIGCDSALNMGIAYNGEAIDGGNGTVCASSYPNYGDHPPLLGVQMVNLPVNKNGDTIRMANFMWYNNDTTEIGNPARTIDYYHYMQAIWRDSTHLTKYGNGHGGSIKCNYAFPSDPTDTTTGAWSKCHDSLASIHDFMGDVRFLMDFGSFTFKAGDVINFTYDMLFYHDTTTFIYPCPSFSYLTNMADSVKATNVTGINNVEKNNLQLTFYPNPMDDAGTFSFKPNTVKEIKLFNILGQQVRDLRAISSSTSVQLQRGNLTAGIYFYSATTTNGIISNGKIVIQ